MAHGGSNGNRSGKGKWSPVNDETASNSAVKQELPEVELDDDAIDDDTSRVRGPYQFEYGRALAGPLSVNDPEFACFSLGGINPVLSESFFTLCSPFGPPGARNIWRMQSREAPEHVHRLLRAFVAAQDYAGAARALSTLHRLMVSFDPDVYRYTSALLRLAGDHQQICMYFRKIIATKSRGHAMEATLQGRVVVHDFLSYLADRQDYNEALSVSKGILQSRGKNINSVFKNDPMLKAHIAILFLFAGLLEYQNGQPSDSPSAQIPGLQDPLALIERLRVCQRECSVGSKAGIGVDERARVLAHLGHAKKLLRQAATALPGNASITGYRAAFSAVEGGSVSALRHLADFVERNPGNVKGRALHVRLLQAIIRDANNQDIVNVGVATKEGEEGEEVKAPEEELNNGLTLAEVARARALRSWLDVDPLEPRAALGLAALHSECPEALLGVVDESFLVKHLLEQLEMHGFPRTYPPVQGTTVSAEGVLYTSRTALALWDALAKILGALRVRDDPVPLFPRYDRAMPTLPAPRPGTLWDEVFGWDPPWNPTDFQRQEGANGDIGKGARWEGAQGDSPRPLAPHPLMRGVDWELWEETLLDPNAEPLFRGKAMDTLKSPRNVMLFGRVWCSDDEDCLLTSDSQALKEGARLATRKAGGCVYYSPPGAEKDVVGWGLGDRSQRKPEVRSASSGPLPDDQRTSGDEERKSNTCEGKGVSVVSKSFDLTEIEEDGGTEGNEGAREVGGDTRSEKRRRSRLERQQEGGPKKRRASIISVVDSQDDDDPFEGEEGSDFPPEVVGVQGEGNEHYSSSSLHEEEAPLGPPVGDDPAALELSETVSVRIPDEEAIWLLVNKASVAAHVFGPQHRYCLMAIARLSLDDLRCIARPARDALRRRGFRLPLSIGRLAADINRDNAAKLGKGSIAWDLQEAPSFNALPPNAYIPRSLRDLVR